MRHDGDSRDEPELLRAAVDDPAAFARFYRRHVEGVIAFFHRRTGDAELAADLTAETFAAALEGCHRYAPERGAPAAWLYGIAHRQLAILHRHGRVERRARRRLGMARLEQQLIAAHARRPRGLRAAVPSRRGAGALVLAAAAAAVVAALIVALASPSGGVPGRP